MKQLQTLDLALFYDHLGCSTLPLRPRDKAPCGKWKRYQDRRPTRDELRKWFGGGQRNIGIICGTVSERLLVRDFDTSVGYDDWATREPDLANELPTCRTSRGFHVYARSDTPTASTCLDDGELRSDGNYVVAPPSIHPSGMAYTWTLPPGDDIPTINLQASGLVPESIAIDALCVTHVIGGGSMTCVTLGGQLDDLVARAIRRTQPTGSGQRNACLFELARHLKQILPDAETEQLEGIVRRWFSVAQASVQTKDFLVSWDDFCRSWATIRIPKGATLRLAAERADDSLLPDWLTGNARRLAAICRELQRMHGEQPFFLDCRNAGLLIGVHYRTAHRRLRQLCDRGVLQQVSSGSWENRRANEYRYRGPEGLA